MLPPEYRNVLVGVIPLLVTTSAGFRGIISDLGKTHILVDLIPTDATYGDEVRKVVDRADLDGWCEQLVDMLLLRSANNPDLKSVKRAFVQAAAATTDPEPFREVLLDGNRLFVDRRELRNTYMRLISPTSESVLLVDGAPQTGKTFSFYLLNHGASRRGFRADLVRVSNTPHLADLVSEMLALTPANVAAPLQGNESAERWAQKLAPIVGRALVADNTPRFIMFDDFPASLPPETLSFIVRFARFVDEAQPRILRLVLVRFPGDLTPEVTDIAAREELHPFTPLDMVEAFMQIVRARGWEVDEATVNTKILEFEAGGQRTLRDRFTFLRSLLQTLAAAANQAAA